MKPIISALDFARLVRVFEVEGDLVGPGEVAKKLRELADLIEQGTKRWECPKLALMKAYSAHGTEYNQIASSVLVLEFQTFLDPAWDPRIVGTGSDEEKQLRLKEYYAAEARAKQKEEVKRVEGRAANGSLDPSPRSKVSI